MSLFCGEPRHSRRQCKAIRPADLVGSELLVARGRIVSGSWESNGARISFSQTCRFSGCCDGGSGAPDGPHSVSHASRLSKVKTAPFGVTHGALEIGGLDAGPQLVLMDADDPRDQSPLMSFSLITLNQRSCSLFW
jgi:hypothetical protein